MTDGFSLNRNFEDVPFTRCLWRSRPHAKSAFDISVDIRIGISVEKVASSGQVLYRKKNGGYAYHLNTIHLTTTYK